MMNFACRTCMPFFFIFSSLVFPLKGDSQNLSEWFSQKKTQKKYLVDQLAANQLYLEFLKKGYQITTTGIQSVRDIKQGSFSLHQLYFHHLGAMNPLIRQYGRVADVIAFQLGIFKELHVLQAQLQVTANFSIDQQHYFLGVASRLICNCADLMQQLYACLGAQLEMSAQQRIARIDTIYEQMLSNRRFSQVFFKQVHLLQIDRWKQGEHVQWLNHLLDVTQNN